MQAPAVKKMQASMRDFTEPHSDREGFFAALPAKVNGDARLVHRGRFFDAVIGWGVDDDLRLIHISRGRITKIDRRREASLPPTFSILAPGSIWAECSKQYPRPGCQDILAMIDMRLASVEGDLLPFFANLLYVKGLFAMARADRSAS
jgi:hypothetical protein